MTGVLPEGGRGGGGGLRKASKHICPVYTYRILQLGRKREGGKLRHTCVYHLVLYRNIPMWGSQPELVKSANLNNFNLTEIFFVFCTI